MRVVVTGQAFAIPRASATSLYLSETAGAGAGERDAGGGSAIDDAP